MRALLYSNIYIALAAASLSHASARLMGDTAPWSPLATLTFSATLLVYNLDRLVGTSREDMILQSPRHTWIRDHAPLLRALTVASALGVAASLPFLSPPLWAALAPMALLAGAYSLPLVITRRGRRRLKDIPGLKIVLIALTWTLVTVALPALDSGLPLHDRRIPWLLAQRFLFILAITLPFDIRDIERDRRANITTIPTLLGRRHSRWLALALMLAFTLLSALHHDLGTDLGLSMLTLSGIVFACLWFSHKLQPEWYYVGLLDGTLFLYAGAIYIAFA